MRERSRRRRALLTGALLVLAAVSLGAAAACGGRRGAAPLGASLRVRGGPEMWLDYVGRPTRRMTTSIGGPPPPSAAASFGATVRFRLEYQAFTRFYIVANNRRLLLLDVFPEQTADGFPAGEHRVDVLPGPWAYSTLLPCDIPCYLVALASPSPDVHALSPFETPPLAPGYTSPDSLLSWVAREAVGLRDSVPWTGVYRRLPPYGRW